MESEFEVLEIFWHVPAEFQFRSLEVCHRCLTSRLWSLNSLNVCLLCVSASLVNLLDRSHFWHHVRQYTRLRQYRELNEHRLYSELDHEDFVLQQQHELGSPDVVSLREGLSTSDGPTHAHNNKTHFFCIFYTLIKHGLLTNQSVHRVLSIF